jgi:hypothetical protein
MRTIVLTTLLATVVFGGSSGAFAQSVETYPDKPYYHEEYDDESMPRVYRYRSDSPVIVIPMRPGSCGEYRYWNGQRCVDARVVPPDIE